MRKILFINPPLHVKLNDTFTTGIVFLPFILAEAVGIAESQHFDVEVIDLFGGWPNAKKVNKKNGEMVVGGHFHTAFRDLKYEELFAVVVFANHISNYPSVKRICSNFRGRVPHLCVLENSEAVTAYSLNKVQGELRDWGASHIFTHDIEGGFLDFILAHAENAEPFEPRYVTDKGSLLSEKSYGSYMPSWQKFPIENYWRLGFGHGPITEKKYLTILTSKGCPFPCEFCVIPELTKRHWRFRTPGSVFEEMVHFYTTLGVTEFHIEDVNPTINCERLVKLADIISGSTYKNVFTWKIVSGTKLETIKNSEMLQALSSGGLNYVSFSPETGSDAVKRSIGKPFNIEHSRNFLRWCSCFDVKTQACFVIGFPGEKFKDFLLSLILVIKLSFWGVSEIAVFIISPIPGSKLYEKSSVDGVINNDNFSFSPIWRKDYFSLTVRKIVLYFGFLLTKCLFRPLQMMRSLLTLCPFIAMPVLLKMEMATKRSKFYKKMVASDV